MSIEQELTAKVTPVYLRNYEHARRQRAFEDMQGDQNPDPTVVEERCRPIVMAFLKERNVFDAVVTQLPDLSLHITAGDPENPSINIVIQK